MTPVIIVPLTLLVLVLVRVIRTTSQYTRIGRR